MSWLLVYSKNTVGKVIILVFTDSMTLQLELLVNLIVCPVYLAVHFKFSGVAVKAECTTI